MPPLRPVARAVRARELLEGAGVLVRRTVGTPALPNLDPFLMLDHLSSSVAAAKQGFPTHPHRGQTTVSIMLRGGMEHRDSLGNRGVVSDGGVQVMRAGNGILHSEHPTPSSRRRPEDNEKDGGDDDDSRPEIEGFQLWVNLPAARKAQPPGYQDVEAEEIPTARLRSSGAGAAGGAAAAPAATARVIAGRLRVLDGSSSSSSSSESAVEAFVRGPARLAPPDVLLADVTVPAGGTALLPVDDAHSSAFAYVYESSAGATLGGSAAPARHALVLAEAPQATPSSSASVSDLEATAGPSGPLRFLLAAGRPIGEPIVQHGPFVMNTRAEIERAFREYSEGTFVKHGAGHDPFADADAAVDGRGGEL